jgi:hypothetical protein
MSRDGKRCTAIQEVTIANRLVQGSAAKNTLRPELDLVFDLDVDIDVDASPFATLSSPSGNG